MSRRRVMALVIAGPCEAGAAVISPSGTRVRVAALPFRESAFRRPVIDASAIVEMIRRWTPDELTSCWSGHLPRRDHAGFAISQGVIQGVFAASGLPIGAPGPVSFEFDPDPARARRRAALWWPHAAAEFALGTRALADAAGLAEHVRDPHGYDWPAGRRISR